MRGKRETDITMDSATFTKLAKECGLVNKSCTSADVDVIFSKVCTRFDDDDDDGHAQDDDGNHMTYHEDAHTHAHTSL